MARPLRVEFAGADYHVMGRRNDRQTGWRDNQDRVRFLETLTEMVERFGVRLHAYCLMPNHYHLLLKNWTNIAEAAIASMPVWNGDAARRIRPCRKDRL